MKRAAELIDLLLLAPAAAAESEEAGKVFGRFSLKLVGEDFCGCGSVCWPPTTTDLLSEGLANLERRWLMSRTSPLAVVTSPPRIAPAVAEPPSAAGGGGGDRWRYAASGMGAGCGVLPELHALWKLPRTEPQLPTPPAAAAAAAHAGRADTSRPLVQPACCSAL